jgi:hypothetical protein
LDIVSVRPSVRPSVQPFLCALAAAATNPLVGFFKKFGIGILYKNVLSKREYRERHFSYSHTLLRVQQEEGRLPENRRTFNEETSEFLRLEHNFLW